MNHKLIGFNIFVIYNVNKLNNKKTVFFNNIKVFILLKKRINTSLLLKRWNNLNFVIN